MTSSSSSLPSDIKSQLHPFTPNLIDIINLKYEKFLSMLDELNSIAEYFLDDNGYMLSFRVVDGTDLTFLWKLTVRIECSKLKVDVDSTCINNQRVLRLNQFLNFYNHIKQQSEALKIFENANLESSTSSTDKPTTSKCSLHESKLFDTIQSMSQSIANDSSLSGKEEDICCICMESKSNLILACTHSYCELCIKEWQVTSNTCPICRCKTGENDSFVLADKPDYYIMQDEMSKSLFQITENHQKSSRQSIVLNRNSKANENENATRSDSGSDSDE